MESQEELMTLIDAKNKAYNRMRLEQLRTSDGSKFQSSREVTPPTL